MPAGIGFAKTFDGNAALIAGLPRVRSQLQGCLQGMPLMIGTSRKGFLGKITGAAYALTTCLFNVLVGESSELGRCLH